MEKQQRYAEAEEYFKMVLKIYDRDKRHWYRLINVQLKQKKYTEALQNIRKALQLFPDDKILLTTYEEVSGVVNQMINPKP